jgi:hypothetical protein
MVSFIESGYASDNILDGHVPVNELCTNFENKNWPDDYYSEDDDNYWHGPPIDRDPTKSKKSIEHKKWVIPPAGGKPDSLGALEIGRINDSDQQEMLSPTFKKKLGKVLKRADKPVFSVRVYLPPFNEWGNGYGFGFRQQTYARAIESSIPAAVDDKYSTSIWVKSDWRGIRFYFRAANGRQGDEPDGPMVQPGWWTWAIAFDDNGIGHYYISKGTNVPTKNDEVFDTSRFPAPNNPLMDEIEYSYFAISEGGGNPKFVIDDYEVWVVKRLSP